MDSINFELQLLRNHDENNRQPQQILVVVEQHKGEV
jgi:hypothetical protein